MFTIRAKLYLLVGIIIAGLSGALFWQYKDNVKLKADKTRLTNNLIHKDFKIGQYITKDKKKAFVITNLELTKSEFEKINSGLTAEIDNMKVKLKNVQSVGQISSHTEVFVDTVPVYKYGPKSYRFGKETQFYSLSGRLNVRDTLKPIIDSVKVLMRDKLTYLQDIEYKGWWFWRKPVSFKLHLKSENPGYVLDTVQVYQLIKK